MESKKLSDKEIEALKVKHGDVFEVEADGKYAYLKRPDRSAMGTFLATRESTPIKAAEYLIKNCWVSGDEELREKDAYFLGLVQVLDQLIEVRVVELKKL